MSIKILGYTPVNRGHLLGYVSICIEQWGLEIHSISVWQKEGKRWFNFPSRSYKEKGTENTKHALNIRFQKEEVYNRFMSSLRIEFDHWCMKQAGPSVFQDQAAENEPETQSY